MKIGHVHDYKSDDVAQWQSTRKSGRRFESAHRPQSNSTKMEKKTIDMNLSIVDAFKKRFPDLDIKNPTWAALGVTAEFRKLKVGDVVLFPINSYNYQTIRSTPATSMIPEVLNEGRKWTIKLDKDNKSIAVLRIA